MLYLVWRIQ